MSIEFFPGGSVYEESILTIDKNGEEVYIPLSEIPELEQNPYPWGDAMYVTFDDNEGEDDE